MNLRKQKIVIAIILVIGCLFQILFAPLSNLSILGERIEAQIGLPIARRKWEAQKITHYQFDIKGYVPLVCIFGAGIEVKDGVVVNVGKRSDYAKNPLASVNPPDSGEISLCNYHNYTIPQLFDVVGHYSITGITFDRKYGFVAEFRFGDPGGRGLLNPKISDCCGGFRIENFQPIQD